MRGDRPDPGPCPICGAPHCSCRSSEPLTQIVQLPMRDAAAAAVAPAPLECERIQAELPPGHFTTGTYRRRKRPMFLPPGRAER